MAFVIETNNLVKEYSTSFKKTCRALDGVTLSVSKGEIVALLGLNGAGKSTLTKILLNLVRPTSGSAFLFGKPLTSPDWKKNVGYLPELFHAPVTFTAHDVLSYLGELGGLKGKKLTYRIEEVLSKVDLLAAKFQKVATFSKGMVLRLGIAQALLNEPKLLFLDEPTEGLDPLGKRMIRNLLLELPSNGVTVLINSHLLSEIELVAHRIAIIHKGRLIAQGALNDLLPKDSRFEIETSSKPAFQGMYSFQERGSSWICEVQGTERLQELLGHLKQNNIPISAIHPLKTTLEDIFFAYIRGA